MKTLTARAAGTLSTLGFLLSLGIPAIGTAVDRYAEIRFLPPEGSQVDGYIAYLSENATGLEESLDLGFPTPEPDGVVSVLLPLDEDRSYGVQLTAYNAVGESQRSNTIDIEVIGCDYDDDGLANRCDCDYDQDGRCTTRDFASLFLPCFVDSSQNPACVLANHDCDAGQRVDNYDFTTGFLPNFQKGAPCE